ncbi:MAG TPA: hypothetical protein VMW69_05025 [Spirochaetia bacterium]|nr:hypothetical protein [Spirochaetia bacterium]
MVRLIVGGVILVALAILLILNVNYTSSLNLFGAQFQNVSVIVIAMAGFMFGIVASIVLHVGNLISKQRKSSQKKTRDGLKEQEADLKAREELAQSAVSEENPGVKPKVGSKRR